MKTLAICSTEVTWPQEALVIRELGRDYYDSVLLGGQRVYPGDHVLVRTRNPSIIPVMRIAYLWRDENGTALFHGNLLWHGVDTVLGEHASPTELFDVDRCCELPLGCATKWVKVTGPQENLLGEVLLI